MICQSFEYYLLIVWPLVFGSFEGASLKYLHVSHDEHGIRVRRAIFRRIQEILLILKKAIMLHMLRDKGY
jgi:hypothetical protein